MVALLGAVAAAVSLQAAIEERAEAVPGTGIAVGVIDHGKQSVYVAGSTGNGGPVDARTLFEIGSVTKTFTATTLASMVLAREVRLSDPISPYLPAGVRAPSKDGKQITLLDLAEQRSGLPRLPANMDPSADDPYAHYALSDMYAFLSGYALTRDPGAQYEYSNYGIALLGQLLANRARTTYSQLVAHHVLDPLGMTGTTFARTDAPDPTLLAVGHDIAGSTVTTWHMESALPAGGIISNLDDMLKYLRCNMGQGSLAPACTFAQRPRAQGEPRHEIGLVWNVNAGNGIISHGGDTVGFHAFVAISPDRQRGVVALSNGPTVTDIATHVMLPDFPIATCPSSVPASKADPASYTGVYCNVSGGITFTVEPSGRPNELSIALVPQSPASPQRIDPDTYYAAPFGAAFRFVRRCDNVVGLWLIQNGIVVPAVRIDASGRAFVAQLSPLFPPPVALTSSQLREYVGSYTIAGAAFAVTLHGDQLFVQLTGQPAFPIFPSAKDEFFLKVVLAQIHFERDASGAVTALTLHQNGENTTATRAAVAK